MAPAKRQKADSGGASPDLGNDPDGDLSAQEEGTAATGAGDRGDLDQAADDTEAKEAATRNARRALSDAGYPATVEAPCGSCGTVVPAVAGSAGATCPFCGANQAMPDATLSDHDVD